MLASMRYEPGAVTASLLLGLAVLFALPARADVVPPPPDDCPAGTTPRTNHFGPYCEPPPPESCPDGHVAKVYLDKAYCEPPPAEVCPPGSHWISQGPDDLYCRGGRPCGEYDCPEGDTCVESSLCVRQVRQFRMMYEVASKVCEADGDCDEGETCVTAKRCDPVQKRQPASPAEAGASVEPPAPAPVDDVPDPQEQVATAAAPAATGEDEVSSKGCSVSRTAGTVLATLVMAGLLWTLVIRRG